ncbi:hypothetical protein N7548_00240 [Acholeplasma manati]|uniref:Uncharacterized protein n=1 Tax=Paracholeplasma manati TaxID=591373 RepID=A0ABT2Y3E3_9MOLU|nr:hypothetical protein [Paracholeplasma manati]MCV2231254.1 hypothetical protein [Paracholeplasma manati]
MRINRTDNTQMRQLWDKGEADQKDNVTNDEKRNRGSYLGLLLGILFVVVVFVVALIFR